MKALTATEKIVTEMLKENTGRHMLDSGGIYGRNFESNQSVTDFRDQPEAWYEANVWYSKGETRWEILPTVSLFHFLTRRLEYAPELQAYFDEYAKTESKLPWLGVMKAFPEWLEDRIPVGCGGLYGDGSPLTVNTYNHESLLSQVIQYVYFTLEPGVNSFVAIPGDNPIWDLEGTYVLLQIHGGCDVRGGYTVPRCFRASDEMAILDDSHCDLVCTRCRDHNWYTDDGYHFYASYHNRMDPSAPMDLNEYGAISYEDLSDDLPDWKLSEDGGIEPIQPLEPNPNQTKLPHCNVPTIELPKPQPNMLVVTEDKHLTCPLCGGPLEVWTW